MEQASISMITIEEMREQLKKRQIEFLDLDLQLEEKRFKIKELTLLINNYPVGNLSIGDDIIINIWHYVNDDLYI